VAVVLPFTSQPAQLLGELDGLVLAVGRDLEPPHFHGRSHSAATPHSPWRDRGELALATAAIATGTPVLGICRRMQVINVALGGTLHPDHSVLPGPAAQHPGGDWDRWEKVVSARLGQGVAPDHPSHAIVIEPDSLLATALGTHSAVNSYHHQSLDRLGEGVRVTARAGDGVIEAIEVPEAPQICLGVQWELQEQPESPVFDLFVDRARELRELRRRGGTHLAAGAEAYRL
jgi:putative glutamine amidotransferase